MPADNDISISALELIEQAIDSKIQRAVDSLQTQRYRAVVTDILDDGTVLVHIHGGAERTPIYQVNTTVQIDETVDVINVNGKFYLDANVTSPVATATHVEQAVIPAVNMAEEAQAQARVAASAAVDAETQAARATGFAQQAAAQVDEAKRSADAAAEQAEVARQEAVVANANAIAAGQSLSEVERVVGTLNWISEHGTYKLTEDTAIVPDRVYYTLSGGSYALTTDTEVDSSKQYYELVAASYALTTDTEIDADKTYYVYDSANDEYTAVAEPDVADIATYYELVPAHYEPVRTPVLADIASYYERSGYTATAVAEPTQEGISGYFVLVIDESVQNYIASHLALTDDGLVVAKDGSMCRLLLSSDGMYFKGTDGRDVCYIEVDPVSNESLFYVKKAVVVTDLRFADWQWTQRANGHLSLKWIGEEV